MEGYDTRDGGNRGKKGEERWNVGKTNKEEKRRKGNKMNRWREIVKKTKKH